MTHAVESRQPFLDYRLLEFGLRLPPKFKAHRGISKFLLRSAVREFIPKTRRRDFRKIGLNFPIDQWMRGPLKPWLFNNLLDKQLPLYNFADFTFVEKLLNQHINKIGNHSLKLWDLACANHWLTRNFS